MTYPMHETNSFDLSDGLPYWLRDQTRIIVGGSLTGQPTKSFEQVMDVITNRFYPDVVYAHGDAKGTDQMVQVYCDFYNIQTIKFRALWDIHGRRAGSIRTEEMVCDFQPTFVLAFPGGNETRSLVSIAKKFYVDVCDLSI